MKHRVLLPLLVLGILPSVRAAEPPPTGVVYLDHAKGDFVLIPKGVPHWFKEVEAPCLYFVVRVTE